MKLLIAEDAPDVAEVLVFGARMTWPGCRATIAATGQEAIEQFLVDPADLVILDIGIPSPDGFEVCRRIRAVSSVPVMILTVREGTLDKVRALDLGADDFLSKPFDHLELFARLRALLRRSTAPVNTTGADFVVAGLSLSFATQEVRVGGTLVRLTSTEYRLLEELVRHAGTVMPHQLLLERVWGSAYAHDIGYLKVFIRRLRMKLGDDADRPRYIHTEWGIGYRFVAPS